MKDYKLNKNQFFSVKLHHRPMVFYFWVGGHRTLKCAQMFLLRIKDRAKCCKGKGLHGGGHHTEKPMLGGRDTAHTLLMGGTIGVGTPHNIEKKSLIFRFPTDAVAEWVGGCFQLQNIATSWLHLASWNLLDFQHS